MRVTIDVKKEVTLGDLETSALYMGLDLQKIEVIERGRVGAIPPHYRMEVEIPDDAIRIDTKGRSDGQQTDIVEEKGKKK